MADSPLILVTNDDGIRSPGIRTLAEALEAVAEVIVVAPSRQQSAVSHKITLGDPLRVENIAPRRFAVTGTPADAVFTAVNKLCPRRPDLVVSGTNLGLNLGTDLFYSGTLAGAVEGAINGIAGFAISQQLPDSPTVAPEHREGAQKASLWDPLREAEPEMDRLLRHAARFAAGLARVMLARRLSSDTVVNVNLPNTPTTEYCWTRIGRRVYRAEVIERIDPRGIPYFWIGGPAVEQPDEPGTDSWAVHAGLASISALRLDWNAANGERILDDPIEGFDER